jgi:MoxR-like ATPase
MKQKEKKEESFKEVSPKEIKEFADKIKQIRAEISKVIVGQEKTIDSFLRAIICNGHVLVEGVPGIAKTLIIKVIGAVSGCDVKRVQFTVDLLPTDIVGLTIYRQGYGFEVVKGPIFTNLLIADEINRSPPKTQSALLEAMQEKQVTIGRETFFLPKPFFVMATANPIEQSGVYNLPEAQIDRFLFKVVMGYTTKEDEKEILKKNTDFFSINDFKLKKIISPNEIMAMQKLVKGIYVSDQIRGYILNIVSATRDKKKSYSKYIEWGASPRATMGLFIASQAEALMNGRGFVTPQDIKNVSFDVLRHRIMLGYEAEADNLSTDDLIKKILEETVVP